MNTPAHPEPPKSSNSSIDYIKLYKEVSEQYSNILKRLAEDESKS